MQPRGGAAVGRAGRALRGGCLCSCPACAVLMVLRQGAEAGAAEEGCSQSKGVPQDLCRVR